MLPLAIFNLFSSYNIESKLPKQLDIRGRQNDMETKQTFFDICRFFNLNWIIP